MSGIVGIVNLDGEPLDPRLLTRMTNFLGFRGPDAKRTWIDGAVGFGHTLLRTTDESQHEEQPFTFDGKIWIVADARIDARGELISKLNTKGCAVNLNRPDVELILRAYDVWGQECLQHLLGDFAFGIWDGPHRTLFCARDHLGVKPFYYAQAGSTVIFSNTLDCIRLHPDVSNRLNDQAVADFLLFDANRKRDTTLFADIQRIAPAHSATWTKTDQQVRRYWTLPIDEPIQYRRLDDYTDRFKELLRKSVNDRLRTDHVGVFMSGGIDSPTLAATAHDLFQERPGGGQLCAFTWVFDGIDQERCYATMVAEHVGIPISFRDGNAEGIDSNWEQSAYHTPEPPSNPLILAKDRAFYQSVAAHNRVVLYGEGPDTSLYYEWRPYLKYLADRRCYGRLVRETLRHMTLHRRVPLLPTIPRMIRARANEQLWDIGYPTWLNREFERRLNLPGRWAEAPRVRPVHPVRPRAYAALHGPQWVYMFEEHDSATTGAPLEFRNPYFDIRLLRYLLAVPALPWCRVKYLIRRAMRRSLPKAVLRRPKAPLDPNPWVEFSRRFGFQPIVPAEGFEQYVDVERVPGGTVTTSSTYEEALRPRRLNYWLKNIDLVR
jgi:asparagine synthase (glutamine-hydrolysing)